MLNGARGDNPRRSRQASDVFTEISQSVHRRSDDDLVFVTILLAGKELCGQTALLALAIANVDGTG